MNAALQIHEALGPGLLESVYETVLAHEVARRGHLVERQVPISICYDNLVFEAGFKVVLLVDGLVVVERKSVENLAPVHEERTRTDVRLANKRLGLLLDFGAVRMVEGITRVAHGLPDDEYEARPAGSAALRLCERYLPEEPADAGQARSVTSRVWSDSSAPLY